MQDLYGFHCGSLIDGRYRVVQCLGIGAMGSVFHVQDQELRGDSVALKLLHPHLNLSDDGLERFRNEVRLARRLIHPHVVRVYEFGKTSAQQLFITMEYVEGVALSELVLQGSEPIAFEDAVALLLQIAAGLSFAHSQGVLHRDVKPSNVLVHSSGVVKLSDFGTARAVGGTNNLTRTGECVGTPFYMSPEQLCGEAVDFRSDVYSFGITAFELLSGKKPFIDDSYYKLVLKHSSEPLPEIRLQRDDVPQWFADFLGRCTAKDPEARYRSMGEVLETLQQAVTTGNIYLRTDAARSLLNVKLKQEAQTLQVRRRKKLRRRALSSLLILLIAVPALRKVSGAHPSSFMRIAYWAYRAEEVLPYSILIPLRYAFGVDRSRDEVPITKQILTGRSREMNRYTAIAQIRAGTNVHVRDAQGYTPLLLAAEAGDHRLFRELLDAGAQVNDRLPDGRTALHLVSEVPEKKLVRRALARGADPSLQDSEGRTALHYYAVRQARKLIETMHQCLQYEECRSGKEHEEGRARLRALASIQDHRGNTPLLALLDSMHNELSAVAMLPEAQRPAALVALGARLRAGSRIARRLIVFGSDVQQKNKSGKSVLDYVSAIEIEALSYPLLTRRVQSLRPVFDSPSKANR